MKYIFLLLSLVFVVPATYSQSRPQNKIRKVFLEQFPRAQNVKWESEGDRKKNWRANFDMANDSMQARYDYKGNWTLTLTFISVNDLPEAVRKTIYDDYMGSELKRAAIFEAPDFKGYGVAFTYKKDRWAVQISDEGKVIRRRVTTGKFEM